MMDVTPPNRRDSILGPAIQSTSQDVLIVPSEKGSDPAEGNWNFVETRKVSIARFLPLAGPSLILTGVASLRSAELDRQATDNVRERIESTWFRSIERERGG